MQSLRRLRLLLRSICRWRLTSRLASWSSYQFQWRWTQRHPLRAAQATIGGTGPGLRLLRGPPARAPGAHLCRTERRRASRPGCRQRRRRRRPQPAPDSTQIHLDRARRLRHHIPPRRPLYPSLPCLSGARGHTSTTDLSLLHARRAAHRTLRAGCCTISRQQQKPARCPRADAA